MELFLNFFLLPESNTVEGNEFPPVCVFFEKLFLLRVMTNDSNTSYIHSRPNYQKRGNIILL